MVKRFGLYLFAVTIALATTVRAADVGEDGLHKQSWFAVTFKDIREDIETARDEGKRLLILIEQRGCIYCQRLHEKVLSDDTVASYMKANFKVVQFNMFGDEEVTDLDGKSLTEKTAARKWGLNFTPTMLFLPETAPKAGTAKTAAVAVMPGAFGKWTTLHMLQWVREKGYKTDEPFQKYHARKLNEARAAGKF
ncbi:MAG: thioredoxin family protein [Pseudomonadota bacterium]